MLSGGCEAGGARRASGGPAPVGSVWGIQLLHEEFADRVAERLEAAADELEGQVGSAGNDPVAVRARRLRVAADVALQGAAVVTREEAQPPVA